jgi:hypothetical protein
MPFYDNSYYESTPGRQLFEDTWALEANREPCLICGHPTGDCSGDNSSNIRIAGFGTTEGLRAVQKFLVEEDIYVERQITPFFKTKILLHKKGKQIPYLEAEELGLIKN